MSLHRLGYQRQQSRFPGAAPHAESKASTGTKNTISFCRRFPRPRKVQHAECTCHRIKTSIVVVKILSVCGLEFRFGKTAFGFIDHVLCNVGADYIEATMCGFCCHIAGPTSNVEKL